MANKEKTPPKKSEEAPEKSSRAEKTEQASGPKKSPLKMILIIVVVALAMGAGGAFVGVKLLAPHPPAAEGAAAREESPAAASESSPGDEEEPLTAPSKAPARAGAGAAPSEGGAEEGVAAAQGPVTVKLDPFTTNLNETSGRRFLKVTLSMEVDSQDAADELNRVMPAVQDSILILLSSLSFDDISTVDGKERLRSQILKKTNDCMKINRVRKVNYSEFVIQ